MSAPLNPPITYQQALAMAAEAIAARKAPIPTAEYALAVTAATAESIIAARDRAAAHAKQAIGQLWATVNPYSAQSVAAFAAQAARIMGSAQSAAATAAAVGQAQQLSALGVKVPATQSVPVDVRAKSASVSAGTLILHRPTVDVAYAGDSAKVSAADMTTAAVFQRPAATYRYVLSKGGTDANEQSVQRIDGLIDDNLMLAQRLAQQQVLAAAEAPPKHLDRRTPKTKVIGYRRVIHPELSRGGTCGMCIAASDRLYKVGELLPIHAHCKCTIAAVTEDHDPADDLNVVDLGQLYKQAGGTSVAHLKRTRYKVDDHGELGPVLVPKAKYKPRTTKSKVRAGGTGIVDGKPETPADVAARHLPNLEKSLADLRSRGLADDSPQVKYHREQIERLRGDLRDDESTQMPPTSPPPPPGTGGPGGPTDGGDDNDHPDLTPEDRAAARDAALAIRERAQDAEPAVSDQVSNAVTMNGGRMERFGSRLKEVDSLYRKVQDIMADSDVDAMTASEWIRDSLRYTAVVDESGYWATGSRIAEALVAAGYQRSKVTEGWNRQGYRGRNDTFISPDGFEFELQIHTAASLSATDATHGMYEEERLPTTSPERKAQLSAMQYEIFDAVPIPDDIEWIH